jgi:microcystin-dependent protein
MLIRNPHRPEGILVSVDGRPLDPSAGQHGAVAVFHDITELRRYEAELSVFAGVVAHDLKAPLAVIRGHCETARDVLADEPESPALVEGRETLKRIMNAVDRMGALIDTLLAYTTARDAPLRLQRVALGPLVADVIAERTGHLRSSGRPDIYVGPLPDVTVDPAMLRHVVDNLVGNALKYVQPDRVARVDITAAPAEPGWTRIEIADRGIGIPDDDKPNIFETFHRATSAVGYAGTGLGLAICSRIVERHGGVIGVADNPGGGTRFHFTLPLAGRPEDRHTDRQVKTAVVDPLEPNAEHRVARTRSASHVPDHRSSASQVAAVSTTAVSTTAVSTTAVSTTNVKITNVSTTAVGTTAVGTGGAAAPAMAPHPVRVRSAVPHRAGPGPAPM